MKVNIFSCTLLAAASGLFLAAPSAQAVDGQITFTGSVQSLTCTINGGANNNFVVALPPVSTNALAAPASSAGRTPFAITLEDCTPDSGTVQVQFEPGASVNPDTGQLIADLGGAEHVEIRLLNNDYSKIVVGAALDSQNSQAVSIDGGRATLNYYAEYTTEDGGVTAGTVESRVQYTLTYQ